MVKSGNAIIQSQLTAEEKARHLPMPPFSIKDLRSAIPAHLFERSAAKSFAYTFFDLFLVATLAYAATHISGMPMWARFIMWPAYWFFQGNVGTGLWVIAHEAGHQAFSSSKKLNDAVGWVLHSALLVPYHSWRITHGQHHKHTNHLERDEVFVPSTRSEMKEAVLDSPLVNFVQLFIFAVFGWPAYLIANVASQKHTRRANHFEPSSPLFKERHHNDIVVSDVGVALALAGLAFWAYSTSFANVFFFYGVPYLIVNFFLVTITYLQHSHKDIPHFKGDEWTFIRGALCTVDRDYGFLNYFHHHIADSHVAHHLFSQMPHYNAVKATEYLKPVLKNYYNYDNTFFLTALYGCWAECKFVEDNGEVLYYKKNMADTGVASSMPVRKVKN